MATAVLVGRYVDAPADIDTLAIGSVTVIDEKGKKPSATSQEVTILKVVNKQDIVLPNGTTKSVAVTMNSGTIFKRELEGKIKVSPYKAAVEQSMEVDFTGVTFDADKQRVALRIVMGDNEGFKVRATKTFDIVEAGLTPATAASKLATKVNASYGDVIEAVATGNKIKLTAKPSKIYRGTDGYSGYFQNTFDVSVYTSGEFWSSLGKVIPGVVIKAVTAADKGIGTYPVVRDRERDALGNMGNNNLHCFPQGYPRVSADPAKTYDAFTFSYFRWAEQAAPSYLQNQQKSVEVYVEAGTGAALATVLNAMFAAPVAP